MGQIPLFMFPMVFFAGILVWMTVWAPRQFSIKAIAMAVGVGLLVTGFSGFSDLLSRPKPVSFEWWIDQAQEAQVLGQDFHENVAIYLYLKLPGEPQPRNYSIPWNSKTASELQKAIGEAQRNGGGVRMRLPFEPTLDGREPKFYATPQPAMPPKDATDPPAHVYQQPGENA